MGSETELVLITKACELARELIICCWRTVAAAMSRKLSQGTVQGGDLDATQSARGPGAMRAA
jgi:hypothetical protein